MLGEHLLITHFELREKAAIWHAFKLSCSPLFFTRGSSC